MSGTRWRLLGIGMLGGAAASWLKLQYFCRIPASEACVWGKAYNPIGFPIEALVFGGMIFGVLLLLTRRRRPP